MKINFRLFDKKLKSTISLNTLYINKYNLFIYITIFSNIFIYINTDAIFALVYFTYSSFVMFLLYIMFYKINSIFLKMSFVIFYFGYVVTLPIMYSDISKYTVSGWTAVGKFNFSIENFITIISYSSLFFFIFFIVSLLLNVIFKDKYYYTKKENKSISININISVFYIVIFILLLFIQFPLSSFMFHHKIGIVGLKPDLLPFHLSGILYYYRLFILPIVLYVIVLYFNNNKYIWLLLSLITLEASYSGVMGLSKSLFIIHIFPVIYYLYLQKKIKTLGIFMLYILFMYSFISYSRNFVYILESLNTINLTDLIDFVISDSSINWGVAISSGIFKIIERLGGIIEFIPTYFNVYNINFVSHSYLFEHYMGFKSFLHIDFNEVKIIFGLTLPEDKAYGIGLDTFSYFYLSSQSLVDLILIIFLYSLIGVISEKSLKILSIKYISENNFIIILHMLILFSRANNYVQVFLFKWVPILLLIYLFARIILFNKYKYKVSY